MDEYGSLSFMVCYLKYTFIDHGIPKKTIDDPTSNNATKVIGVHSGFFDALLGKDGEVGIACKNMYEHGKDTHEYGCVAETVKSLGLIEKSYRLYVTGHSLGAAMATLFGFFAASDDYFVQNVHVTIYSYASPKVGNSLFRNAFKFLEVNNRVRHARIRNFLDVGECRICEQSNRCILILIM